MGHPLKIAMVVPDNRDEFRSYADPLPYFGTAPTALLDGLAELPECEVHVVCCVQRPLVAPEKIGPNIFFHTEIVPKWGWLRGGYLGCIRSVRRQLAKIQPDVVHGQGTERYCALSTALSGFPNVVTIHGNMNAIAQLHRSRVGSFHWLAARLEDFTLPRTAGILCISEYVQNLVRRHNVKTWIVPNAIRQGFFDLPRTAVARPGNPLLINVGVVSERKRQLELLSLLESLREQGFSFDTAFVGSVDATSAYAEKFSAQLAAAHGKYGGFAHIPKLDEASLCELMDQAAAMIHFASEETFGLTFAEAIARGLYLFASDVGAARSIARGAENVQIFGVGQWDEMGMAVRKWLAAGAYRKPRPSNPPAEFAQAFHPVAVAKRHLEIYREVLKTRS